MSTEIATMGGMTAEQLEAYEAAASARKRETLQGERIQVPRLDVVQGTTRKPPEGAEPGDMFNTITGDVFGSEVLFLVGAYHRGRAYAEKDDKGKRTGRFFAAGPEAVVPSFWPAQFRGKAFAELPEAEERFREIINNEAEAAAEEGRDPKLVWGSGPPIQTTYNFVGVVVDPVPEDAEPFPVRISMKATSAGQARKLLSMLKPLHTYWQRTVHLSTERRTFDEGPAFVWQVGEYGPSPTPEQRALAIQIDQASEQGRIEEHPGDAESQPSAAAKAEAVEGEAVEIDRGADKPSF